MSDFDDAFNLIISLEGGYIDDQNDSGGETKYGISKKAYPNEDIPNMTLDRAKLIYKRDYWDSVKGDVLPAKLNTIVFDAAVNQGVDAAIKMLQKAVGVAQDGILGRDTLLAVTTKSGRDLCCKLLTERAMRYIGTRGFDNYGRNWFRRLFVVAMEL